MEPCRKPCGAFVMEEAMHLLCAKDQMSKIVDKISFYSWYNSIVKE